MTNNVSIIIKGFISIIIGILVFLFIKDFDIYLNNLIKILIIIIYLVFVYSIFKKRYKLLAILYFCLLISVLFARKKVDKNINYNNYFVIWYKLLFKNKTVFINFFGNILLYMPLQLIMLYETDKIYLSLNISFVLIVLFELIQYITYRGVYDVVDIVLNLIGTCIITLIYEFKRCLYER